MQSQNKFVIHLSTKYPITIDENGILRYFNFPGGSYANAAVHGIPFDYSTIDKPIKFDKEIDKKSFDERKFIFVHEEKDKFFEEINNDSDFIEPEEYCFEITYLFNFFHTKSKKF
uniref:Uncharacterized protein n=1 Tax=Borely moumouvirus TaxID=2712067 RepID=A0A6G6ACK6_9VIRU